MLRRDAAQDADFAHFQIKRFFRNREEAVAGVGEGDAQGSLLPRRCSQGVLIEEGFDACGAVLRAVDKTDAVAEEAGDGGFQQRVVSTPEHQRIDA